MNNLRISVAMATYNGEDYISEQLESIFNQEFLPKELVVCDDGSTDKTIKIIQDYTLVSPIPIRLYNNPVNLGFADNFLKTASLCKSEWIAFCDQDDIWMPEKLSYISGLIISNKVEDLLLITHSAELTDSSLKLLNQKQPNYSRDQYIHRNKHFGFWEVPGFSCVFSSRLISDFDWRIRPPCYDKNYSVLPHDKWICLLANALGSTYHISKPLSLYRRHQSTVTGDYKKLSLQDRIHLSQKTDKENYKYLYQVAKSTSIFLRNLVCQNDQKKYLTINASYFDRLSRIYLLRYKIYDNRNPLFRFIFFIKIILKKGYFGSQFYSLGLFSCLKDMFFCLTI